MKTTPIPKLLLEAHSTPGFEAKIEFKTEKEAKTAYDEIVGLSSKIDWITPTPKSYDGSKLYYAGIDPYADFWFPRKKVTVRIPRKLKKKLKKFWSSKIAKDMLPFYLEVMKTSRYYDCKVLKENIL